MALAKDTNKYLEKEVYGPDDVEFNKFLDTRDYIHIEVQMRLTNLDACEHRYHFLQLSRQINL